MATNRLVEKEKVATYASVLVDAAYNEGGAERVLVVRDQLELVQRTLRSNFDLKTTLDDPTLSLDVRADFAAKVFEACDPVLVEVLRVMVQRGDSKLIDRVWQSFGEALEAKLQVAVVDVETAVELDDELRQLIIKKASSDLGCDCVLREHKNPSILGGIIMSCRGKRIDASMKTQLEHARTTLKTITNGGECS